MGSKPTFLHFLTNSTFVLLMLENNSSSRLTIRSCTVVLHREKLHPHHSFPRGDSSHGSLLMGPFSGHSWMATCTQSKVCELAVCEPRKGRAPQKVSVCPLEGSFAIESWTMLHFWWPASLKIRSVFFKEVKVHSGLLSYGQVRQSTNKERTILHVFNSSKTWA